MLKRNMIFSGVFAVIVAVGMLYGHQINRSGEETKTATDATASVNMADVGGANTYLTELPYSEQEIHCLAQAVYFEARSEPYEGQVAVAHVIMNRVESARYPDNICGVVFQNEHMRHMCQFSFACDGLSDNPYEMTAWQQAMDIVGAVLAKRYQDITGRSTHYHAEYVQPYWADAMQPTLQVGQHIFYREDS